MPATTRSTRATGRPSTSHAKAASSRQPSGNAGASTTRKPNGGNGGNGGARKPNGNSRTSKATSFWPVELISSGPLDLTLEGRDGDDFGLAVCSRCAAVIPGSDRARWPAAP
jgi:hypothetical protein